MALPNDYAGQSCSVARALEIVGERWTLLIVRDAFNGVRRFGDFATHLEIPRAVLTNRLRALVEAQVLTRVPGPAGHDEYELTGKGIKLWPVVRDLMAWGDEYYSPRGPRRILRHSLDDGTLDDAGRCSECGATVDVADTVIAPGPGLKKKRRGDDPLAAAFTMPHQLLTPARS
jgi:DNA-binding HxlR family transcriptional regulator